MKNDINLLYRRRTKTYSSKKIVLMAFLLVIVAVGFYAGITLPSAALNAAKIESAELAAKLNTVSASQQDITNITQQGASIEMKKKELLAFRDSKADILKYLEAIEGSQPSVINISQLTISEDTINVLGSTDSDTSIALFSIKLREQDVFKNIYISNSVTSVEDGITSFIITITLPSTLDSKAIIQEIEKKDDVTSTAAPEEVNKQ